MAEDVGESKFFGGGVVWVWHEERRRKKKKKKRGAKNRKVTECKRSGRRNFEFLISPF